MTFFLIAILFLFTLGYLAQTTGLCLVKGVNQALDKRPQFLIAILLSGVLGWVSLLVAEMMVIDVPFRVYAIQWTALLGGVLFGFGAAINLGCGVSTISKLSRGDTLMIATVSGWLIGWILLASVAEDLPPRLSSALPQWHLHALIVASIIIGAGILLIKKWDTRLWISMLTIGLMASLTFLYEPKWTPSGYLSDLSLSVWEETHERWPSMERTLLLLALVGGMASAALITRSFKLSIQHFYQYWRHLFAGILMGIGASLAGGGNDSQLLLSLPAFSPSGFTAVLSMLFGIFIGLRLPPLLSRPTIVS
ncbi:putative inner membrane protein [Grimontia celer]|uniref:Putative inner membrane protein n=1 Tax=Grimontia celer TaxID=1796497 RepID=A0A128F7N5_9GAMM|nr:YeeE/YedE thiosulfate transporter family protein [Grimontia celer]CZF82807.1 putative inner membrane protein [Grimontia celer]